MPAIPPFAVTWDYRCPVARNAHEHLLDGLAAGADWKVTFIPFFLNQGHVEEGSAPAWEDPAHVPDLLSLEAGVVVRDRLPEQFPAVHRSLFSARHDSGGDLRERQVVHQALTKGGVDAGAVLAEIDSGWPREVARSEHERMAEEFGVFGVPTFIVGDRAVFARLMNRPNGDGEIAQAAIDRIVHLVDAHPELNELKQTRIAR
ncbi:MAG: DsbA family protein [Acidimicrobiales bacterium]